MLLMVWILGWAWAAEPTSAEQDLLDGFSDAAVEFEVPRPLLMAMAYEASRFDMDAVSAWGGYGLFDFREDDSGPNIEDAAILLDISPDEIIDDPLQGIRGAAALLAHQGRLSNDGDVPDPDELVEWWDAVLAFSGRDNPELQVRYADYIYQLVNHGGEVGGIVLDPLPVDHWDRVPVFPPTTCDYGGCAQFTAASSSNYSDYSRTASDIDYVVIHTVQGSYSGCISWFQNSSASVSAHYVVRSSDGEVTQMVSEEDVAWHAGNWSYNLGSVGIEHEGYVDEPETWYTDAMYMASAALTADIADRNGITIDRDHIIAHSEVPSATHTDPGDGWDWDYYMTLVGGEDIELTGDLTGVVADSDIYNGDRIEGAQVWLDETGESTTTDSSGLYLFEDLPVGGAYTVYAVADGFLQGSCDPDAISSGSTTWCSIALEPGEDTGQVGPVDTGSVPTDTADPNDTAGDEEQEREVKGPGEAVRLSELGGCGCHAVPRRTPILGGLVFVLMLAGVRRRR